MSTSIFPLEVWPEGILQARLPANDNSLRVEVLERRAISVLSAPPGSPIEGDQYVLGTTLSGAWSGFAQNDVVIYKSGTWLAFSPFQGWLKLIGSALSIFDGSAWTLFGGSGTVNSIVAGAGIAVDDSDPANPVVSATGGGAGGGSVSPDSPPSTPDDADDEFDGSLTGGPIDTTGVRRTGATPWAWSNQGTAAAVMRSGNLLFSGPAGSSDSLRCLFQPASGTSWVYRAKLTFPLGGNGDIPFWGIAVKNSSNGRIFSAHKLISSGVFRIEGNRWNSETSYNATPLSTVSLDSRWSGLLPFYFEMELNSGNLIARYSYSGIDGTFISLGSEPVASFLVAADRIGIFTAATNNQPILGAWDWFRRIA